jgi:hypothetical protein
MIRSALLFCVLVLASIVAGCAPPPVPRVAAKSCDISSIIHQLKPGFSPVDYGNCIPGRSCGFQDPTQYLADPPSPAAVSAIQGAYGVAPASFQAALCGLYAIYIDTDTDQSKPSAWGMRERLFPNASGLGGYREHIGISATLLATLDPQKPYASYEKSILLGLLQPNPSGPTTHPRLRRGAATWASGLTFTANPDPAPPSLSPSPTAIAVLAILAHEMGHIVWFDKVVGQSISASNGPSPVTDNFTPISWKALNHQHGFRTFGAVNNDAQVQRPPVVADVVRDLNDSCNSCAANDLNSIYGKQGAYSAEWASLFATVAPDEDFVETYKLLILTGNSGGPLQSLDLAIPATNGSSAYSEYVINSLNNPQSLLYAKAQFVRPLFGP